jgi:hypothetical protein
LSIALEEIEAAKIRAVPKPPEGEAAPEGGQVTDAEEPTEA